MTGWLGFALLAASVGIAVAWRAFVSWCDRNARGKGL